MDAIFGVVAPIFWGIVLLSALVIVHEGGHFLAARTCKVRVTEFFVGMPCRYNLHYTSKRFGTKFGVTPLLLGGYAAICGMDPEPAKAAPQVLHIVHKQGTITVEEIAESLEISEDDAMEACVQLMGWGSIVPIYNSEKGEYPGGSLYPTTFAAPSRDAAGNIQLDGKAFDSAHATREGTPWDNSLSVEDFYLQEQSHTYQGKGFFKRAFMLIAGIAVNILTGFLLLMSVYSLIGTQVSLNYNQIGTITQDSIAAKVGLEKDDTIISIDGVKTTDWIDVQTELDQVKGTGPFDIVYQRDGVNMTTTVELGVNEILGIEPPSKVIRLNPIDSAHVSVQYIVATAQAVGDLINPSHTMEVLQGSTSIVGVSILSAQAAAAGPAVFLQFAALISFSLGFMNLLPIPPLDGGKLLIEIIQAIIRRPVPLKIQNALSYIGLFLVLALFVYMLQSDIARFIL